MKSAQYGILVISIISCYVHADRIEVRNWSGISKSLGGTGKHDNQLEVAVVQAKGPDKILLTSDEAKQNVNFTNVLPWKTVRVKRQGLKVGVDRYVVVCIVDKNAPFYKKFGGLHGLYNQKKNKHFDSLDKLRESFPNDFAFAPAGYTDGSLFTVIGGTPPLPELSIFQGKLYGEQYRI
jgi:hypothetical protein